MTSPFKLGDRQTVHVLFWTPGRGANNSSRHAREKPSLKAALPNAEAEAKDTNSQSGMIGELASETPRLKPDIQTFLSQNKHNEVVTVS